MKRALLLGLALTSVTAFTEDDAKMVKGSADYTRTLRLVLDFKKGRLTFEQLSKKVVALKLPPHGQGCAYTMMPVPAPPPGVPFEPASMPADWSNTFGEVAMTFWRGDLHRKDYDALHEAAHGKRPGFPDCRR